MHRDLDLIELMRRHFASSKQLIRASILCNIGVVAISLSTSLNIFRGADVYVPISLLFVQFGAYVLRQLSINNFSNAESVRHTVMLKDALDLEISESQLKRLQQSLKSSAAQELPFLVPYYASQAPPGPGTLLQMLAENCTYTKTIARRASKIVLTVTAINALGVVTVLSLIMNAYPAHTLPVNVNLSTLALLSFWATLDLATMSMRYRKLRRRCSQVRSNCLRLQTAKVTILDEILHSVDEYNCVLAAASPFPIKFCEAKEARLNELWPTRPPLLKIGLSS